VKPGDMIEWVYKVDQMPVSQGETLWSTPMQKWVSIGGRALLVSVTDELYFWLSFTRGLFHARVDDTVGDHAGNVVPHHCSVIVCESEMLKP
jgi:hypothetical protein